MPRKKQVGIEGTIYLLHFSRPFHHAQHYLGWTASLPDRLDRHESGHGAKIISAALKTGITTTLVRLWVGTRFLERKLKNGHNSPRLCPVCKQAKLDSCGKE